MGLGSECTRLRAGGGAHLYADDLGEDEAVVQEPRARRLARDVPARLGRRGRTAARAAARRVRRGLRWPMRGGDRRDTDRHDRVRDERGSGYYGF